MQEPSVTAANPAEPKGLSWGLESRLQFIDFRLRWERHINRMDLTEHFGISVPRRHWTLPSTRSWRRAT